MERSISLKFFTSQSEHYLTVLSELRDRASWFFDGQHQLLSLPFVLTCAAALECSLNDTFLKSLDNKLLIDGYLSMSLRGKLTNVCSIVTENRFHINARHKSYIALAELVSLRNKLVHNKSTYEVHEGHIIDDGHGVRILAESLTERMDDNSFGLNDVGRFHDALIDLHEKLLDVYGKEDFSGNDLVIKPTVSPDEDSLHIVISS